jgi:glutamate-1-semialdehyde 2,1-aminomutase
VPGEPPMFDAVFKGGRVRNYRDSISGDSALSKRFNAMVRARGVLKSDNKIYISLAHDEADIAQVTNAFREAARAL